MNRVAAIMMSFCLPAVAVLAQQPGASPTDTVINFYRALRQKHYLEGFRRSVYRGAVEGLTPAELKDLDPDFARTVSDIPDKIEPAGEQIEGDMALVRLKFEGMEKTDEVTLVRVNSEWLVGDQNTLAAVRAQGRAFFFNIRILVNEAEAYDVLQHIVGAQIVYSQKFAGRCASMKELVRLGGVPKDIEDSKTGGYKFEMTLGKNKTSFIATATPVMYGKTGRLSFYADLAGIRASDLKGRPASNGSPIYTPK